MRCESVSLSVYFVNLVRLEGLALNLSSCVRKSSADCKKLKLFFYSFNAATNNNKKCPIKISIHTSAVVCVSCSRNFQHPSQYRKFAITAHERHDSSFLLSTFQNYLFLAESFCDIKLGKGDVFSENLQNSWKIASQASEKCSNA